MAALADLADAREEIDALNVFPVPDGDTGTNLYLTLEAAIACALALPPDAPVAAVADAFARGALLGARGNSGVIGAEMLRGWAQVLAEHSTLTAGTAVECFRRADEQAWRAVHEPVEGTILSVSRAAARAAQTAAGSDPGGRLEVVVSAAAEAARQALARTPAQLPALAAAGVVDAGGRGLVVLLNALAEVVLADQGRRRHRPRPPHRRPVDLPALDVHAAGAGAVVPDPTGIGIGLPGSRIGDRCGPRPRTPDGPGSGESEGQPTHPRPGQSPEPGLYEVMFLLDTDPAHGEAPIRRLRERLGVGGSSLVIVGGPQLWQVHVHTHDAGAVVEHALDAGRPHRIRITHLALAPAPASACATAATCTAPGSVPGSRSVGLVACAAGPGLAQLFEGVGAVVVAGGPGRRPSTAAILAAITRTGAPDVAVLPNDTDTLSVARIAAASARAEGVRVTVVPTRAQVQGLAAAAVHDPQRRFDDDVVAMSAAAGAARDAAVTIAVRDGLTSAGECRVGDVLGVVDGDFAVIGSSLESVATAVVDRLLAAGGELVTIVVGVGGHDSLARRVAAHARGLGLGLEVNVVDGGQPRYPLLIGVE